MRKLTLHTLLALMVAVAASADDGQKHQSYFSYDDGGTVVRQPNDDRDVEARVNLPVYPGDQIITNRRGRSEIRLADGNVIAIGSGTGIQFLSILGSYEGKADETVIELRQGKVVVYRAPNGDNGLRIDTPSGTYFAADEAIFSVEADPNGRDRVGVIEGFIEVRTPSRTSRLRRGERAQVDDRGVFDFVTDRAFAADDLEHWFVKRVERYGKNSRYLDSTLAYSDDELNDHGSWTYINGYGYGWRPYVGVGWRPYYYGYWSHSPYGYMTWVSYEPWGWAPYHYGRWAYDAFYGWFWLPGSGYAPAWVYWWYGPSYVGWAPYGWYDCYRPYYNWAYRPYATAHLGIGFGFYGRVNVNEVDLRPWTFVDSNTIVSNRIDRAALTTDAVRARIARDGTGSATVSGDPARFTRQEVRDPAAAINRRWKGQEGNTGIRTPATDVTPFFRRDADLSADVRDRVVRSRPAAGAVGATSPRSSGGASGAIGSISRGTGQNTGDTAAPSAGVAGRVNRGNLAPAGGTTGGTSGGATGGVSRGVTRGETGSGRVNRGNETSTPAPAPSATPQESTPPASSWRDRVNRTNRSEQAVPDTPAAAPQNLTGGSEWRGRAVRRAPPADGQTPSTERQGSSGSQSGSVDRRTETSRRVIDRIGGARVRRADEGGSSSSSSESSRSTAERPRTSSGDSGSRSTSPRSVDRSSSRDSSPKASSGSSSSSSKSGSSGKSNSSGSSRGESGGGRVNRSKD